MVVDEGTERPSFAVWLREERLRRGMSQRRLAALIGANLRYVRRLETGDRAHPSAELRARINEAFGATLPTADFSDDGTTPVRQS